MSPLPSVTSWLSRCAYAWLLVLVPGCVLISGNLNPFSSKPEPFEEHVVSGTGKQKILLLDVSRLITNEEEEAPFGITRRESTTAVVREQLQRAADDDRVRAVVLRINSPGGTVTASDTIYHLLTAFKQERQLPLVAQMLDMGTSGAYYVALAADEIVASPTTVTGSVGVVMYGVNLAGLMEKLGVTNQTLKAGEHKDIGSPLRKLTPEDERILQSVLNDMQQRFLDIVRERRPGISDAGAKMIADGRIFTAAQALQAGLIDRIGYLDDTLQTVERRAGLTEARVIVYRRPQDFAENIYSAASPRPFAGSAPAPSMQMNLLNLDVGGLGHIAPNFMYLWLPSLE